MAKAGKRLGKATFVARGYGQVEPNHLSAPQNGQVYARLPAAADIDILENGQFVKYDYAKGVCHYNEGKYKDSETGGVWMMVFNEVKIYRDREGDADFAMLKDNYNARVYSPLGQETSALQTILDFTGEAYREGTEGLTAEERAFKLQKETFQYPKMMPDGTKMFPRVMFISVGDHWTTNTIMAEAKDLEVGTLLSIGADGYLKVGAGAGGDLDPTFAVVQVYTMPDLQPGVKVQRVA